MLTAVRKNCLFSCSVRRLARKRRKIYKCNIDFALESPESKIAIEIDGETYHNSSKVSENKYADDLLKQNSLVYDNGKVYRWIYSQLEKQPEKLKMS